MLSAGIDKSCFFIANRTCWLNKISLPRHPSPLTCCSGREFPRYSFVVFILWTADALLAYLVGCFFHSRFRGYYERPFITIGNQTLENPDKYQFSRAYWHILASKLFFVLAFLVSTLNMLQEVQ